MSNDRLSDLEPCHATTVLGCTDMTCLLDAGHEGDHEWVTMNRNDLANAGTRSTCTCKPHRFLNGEQLHHLDCPANPARRIESSFAAKPVQATQCRKCGGCPDVRAYTAQSSHACGGYLGADNCNKSCARRCTCSESEQQANAPHYARVDEIQEGSDMTLEIALGAWTDATGEIAALRARVAELEALCDTMIPVYSAAMKPGATHYESFSVEAEWLKEAVDE